MRIYTCVTGITEIQGATKKDSDVAILTAGFFKQTKHNQDLFWSYYCY